MIQVAVIFNFRWFYCSLGSAGFDFHCFQSALLTHSLLMCTACSVAGDIIRFVAVCMLIILSCGCSHNGREEVFHWTGQLKVTSFETLYGLFTELKAFKKCALYYMKQPPENTCVLTGFVCGRKMKQNAANAFAWQCFSWKAELTEMLVSRTNTLMLINWLIPNQKTRLSSLTISSRQMGLSH